VSLAWLAWPLAFVVQAILLRLMDRRSSRLAAPWHIATAGLLTLILSIEVAWQVSVNIAGAWKEAAASAVPGILALLIWRFRNTPSWPVPVHPLGYRGLSFVLVGAQAIYLVAAGIALPAGTESPGSRNNFCSNNRACFT
jgi:hypothetical protein